MSIAALFLQITCRKLGLLPLIFILMIRCVIGLDTSTAHCSAERSRAPLDKILCDFQLIARVFAALRTHLTSQDFLVVGG